MLRKACNLTEALGAVLVTQVEGAGPCIESTLRVSHSVAQQIAALLRDTACPPGKPAVITMEIGVSPVRCLAVSTHMGPPDSLRHQRALLAVVLQAGHQLCAHGVGRLEGLVAALGLMLQQNGHAFMAGLATSTPCVGVCAICDNVRATTGRWMRWDELLARHVGVSLSHTVCPSCAEHHYAELLTGS